MKNRKKENKCLLNDLNPNVGALNAIILSIKNDNIFS